jgi:hypothetical protein
MADQASWRFARLRHEDGLVRLTATLCDQAGQVLETTELCVSRAPGAPDEVGVEAESGKPFPASTEAREYLARQKRLGQVFEEAALEAAQYVQPPRWDEAAKQVYVTVYVPGRGVNLRYRLSAEESASPILLELVTTTSVEPRVAKAAERALVGWLGGEANERAVRQMLSGAAR